MLGKNMKRFWLWRLQRAYRTIGRSDERLGRDAYLLRVAFCRESQSIIDRQFAANGINRSQRRQLKREMLRNG